MMTEEFQESLLSLLDYLQAMPPVERRDRRLAAVIAGAAERNISISDSSRQRAMVDERVYSGALWRKARIERDLNTLIDLLVAEHPDIANVTRLMRSDRRRIVNTTLPRHHPLRISLAHALRLARLIHRLRGKQ